MENTSGPSCLIDNEMTLYKTRGLTHRGRNIIESRNGLLKNASGVGIGDRTGRLIRGFSKQWFLVAAAAVAVNIRLVDAYLRRTGQELTPVPPPPTPPARKTNRDAEAEPYWSNAPPAAA